MPNDMRKLPPRQKSSLGTRIARGFSLLTGRLPADTMSASLGSISLINHGCKMVDSTQTNSSSAADSSWLLERDYLLSILGTFFTEHEETLKSLYRIGFMDGAIYRGQREIDALKNINSADRLLSDANKTLEERDRS